MFRVQGSFTHPLVRGISSCRFGQPYYDRDDATASTRRCSILALKYLRSCDKLIVQELRKHYETQGKYGKYEELIQVFNIEI